MLSSSSSWGWTGSDSLSEHAPCAGRMGGCVCAYCTRNVADEMFWWEMCGEERDLVVSENGVYGGGGPRVAVVSVELRGSTTGGEDGVKTLKRKGPLGKTAAAVAEDARLRGGVLWPDEDALLRVGRVRLWYDMDRIRMRCESTKDTEGGSLTCSLESLSGVHIQAKKRKAACVVCSAKLVKPEKCLVLVSHRSASSDLDHPCLHDIHFCIPIHLS